MEATLGRLCWFLSVGTGYEQSEEEKCSGFPRYLRSSVCSFLFEWAQTIGMRTINRQSIDSQSEAVRGH